MNATNAESGSASRRLELDDDDRFQRWDWIVQRVGWAVWLAIIAAAMAGFLGSGPASNAVARSSDDSLQLSFNRYAHHHAVTPIRIEVLGIAPGQGRVEIDLSASFMDAIQLHRVQPEPVRMVSLGDRTRLVFASDAQNAVGTINLFLEYEDIGRVEGAIGLKGRPPVVVKTLVYP
jgi:hypothetical protein